MLLTIVRLTSLCAQTAYHPPVDHSLRLSGTFGELRSGHFHSGIDIKASRGTIGDPVYAVADGVISRIVISGRGYGKALYIRHLDGMTSVYAHLHRFSPELQALARREQHRSENFEIDLEFDIDSIRVRQGTQIGVMGNSGFSFGPHLHFELRDTRSNRPVNPIAFWSIDDQQKPVIREIIAYHIDHKGRPTAQTQLPLDIDTLHIDSWRVGIALDVIDPFNAGRNKNGIHRLRMMVNEQTQYQLAFDTLTLDAMDFRAHVSQVSSGEQAQNLHRCFSLDGTPLTFSPGATAHGIIPLYHDRYQKINLQVADFHANVIEKTFFLARIPEITISQLDPNQHLLAAHIPDTLESPTFQLILDQNSLFHDTYVKVNEESQAECQTSLSLESANPVLKGGAKLKLKMESLNPHSILVRYKENNDSKLHFQPMIRDSDWLHTHISELGNYCVALDTIPPRITLKGRRDRKGYQEYHFELVDNIAGSPFSIRCEVDGVWTLHSFDAKNNSVVCSVSTSRIREGASKLQIEVSDPVGNVTTVIKAL